jgi:rhamnulokinase/L-fuculokinase
VTCIASHDTASAVVAVPTQKDDFIFISCGTWSLLGTELSRPCNDEKAEKYGFTNEGGAENKILFMKNIMGSWLIQASRNRWIRDGRTYGYGELDDMAREAAPFRVFIDVDHPSFINPENMPAAIRAQCERTRQRIPETEGEIVRCIYESLVMKYKKTIEELEDCTGKIYNDVHMIGGGIQSSFMCTMAAAGIGKTVIAGPVEATAYGNAAMQLISLGALRDVKYARQIIANSEPAVSYGHSDHTPDVIVSESTPARHSGLALRMGLASRSQLPESTSAAAWDEAFDIYTQLFGGDRCI